jgi:hypothetical protein
MPRQSAVSWSALGWSHLVPRNPYCSYVISGRPTIVIANRRWQDLLRGCPLGMGGNGSE